MPSHFPGSHEKELQGTLPGIPMQGVPIMGRGARTCLLGLVLGAMVSLVVRLGGDRQF